MGRQSILRQELRYLHSLFIYERHCLSGSHLRIALVCRRSQMSLGHCLSDFHAIVPGSPDRSVSLVDEETGREGRRSEVCMARAFLLQPGCSLWMCGWSSSQGSWPRAESPHSSELLLAPQLLPTGSYAADLCSANAQHIRKSWLLE